MTKNKPCELCKRELETNEICDCSLERDKKTHKRNKIIIIFLKAFVIFMWMVPVIVTIQKRNLCHFSYDIFYFIGNFVQVFAFLLSFFSLSEFLLRKRELTKITVDAERLSHLKSLNIRTAICKFIGGGLFWFGGVIVAMIGNPINSVDKPMIYLYSEKVEKITVKLGREDRLTTTYPKYENSLEVLAHPNGDLIDLETGKYYYGLYWEGKNEAVESRNEGFVVKGEDTISFLEEKLEILGLTEREANEFIVYWLPKMESNKYNFIYFETIEEINENMPLEITPEPDTVIRVVMEYKPLKEMIKVKEQKLSTPERIGFTVVEWGGSEIK